MKSNRRRLVEYVPPKSETIKAFARTVCEAMAERKDDPVFREPHVVCGFAKFLELAIRVQAKRMNALQLVDSDSN